MATAEVDPPESVAGSDVGGLEGKRAESSALIEGAFGVARQLGIRQLLIQAARGRDAECVEARRGDERVLWLTRGGDDPVGKRPGDGVIRLPDAYLSRSSQLSMALFLAVLGSDLEVDESLVCLMGPGSGGSVDTVTITQPARRFPWLSESDAEHTRSLVATPVFARVLSLALRLSAEGREGRAVGTIFAIGDPNVLAAHVRQLILNPCAGHARKARNVHNPQLFETIRELVAMDGALLISPGGVLETAGTYLAPTNTSLGVGRGLGARHSAAAGITAQAPCVAVVVSQSSGTVTTYHEGHAILALERPVLAGTSVKVPRRPTA